MHEVSFRGVVWYASSKPSTACADSFCWPALAPVHAHEAEERRAEAGEEAEDGAAKEGRHESKLTAKTIFRLRGDLCLQATCMSQLS